MAGIIDARLKELDIRLPQTSKPAANYLPFRISGSLVFLSGQISQWEGELRHVGQIGGELSLDEGIAAARLCGLNLIAWLKVAAEGDLDRVSACIRLGGFVNSAPGFAQQPQVINGCSDLMVAVFGEAGRHARAAVGTNALPLNTAVEVEAIFELRD